MLNLSSGAIGPTSGCAESETGTRKVICDILAESGIADSLTEADGTNPILEAIKLPAGAQAPVECVMLTGAACLTICIYEDTFSFEFEFYSKPKMINGCAVSGGSKDGKIVCGSIDFSADVKTAEGILSQFVNTYNLSII